MNKDILKRPNVVFGFSLFVLSVLFYFYVMPNNIQVPKNYSMLMGPRFLPSICVIGLAVLSLFLIIEKPTVSKEEPGDRENKGERKGGLTQDQWRMILCMAVTALSILFMGRISYIIVTIALIALIMVINGERKWKRLILIPGISTGMVYYVFFYLMRVPLP